MPMEPMVRALRAFPGHLRDGVDAGRGASPPSNPRTVVLAGMGGSGIGGALVEGLVSSRSRVPVLSWNRASPPGFLGTDDLVVAVSYSGNTAETLAVARGAVDAGARLVAVTTGGELGALAKGADAAVVEAPPGMHPRNALGSLFGATAGVVDATGVADGIGDDVRAASDALADEPDDLLDNEAGPAHTLAQRLGPDPVDVVGHDVLGVVARRLACQLDENTKVAAAWHVLPEAAHNAIVPWGAGAPGTRLVLVRREHEAPMEAARMDHITETAAVADVAELRVPGRGVELVLRAVLTVDAASVLAAERLDRDPEFIGPINELKQRLASVDQER